MNVLIVDDHPMTADLYENLLLSQLENKPIIYKAGNCKEAYEAIIRVSLNNQEFDLAILDLNLPGYTEKGLANGGDIGFFLKKNYPGCKIIMITSHTEILIIYDLIKRLKPEGIAIKNDITAYNFTGIIEEVLSGEQYQSMLVKQCVKEIWKKDIMIEDYNRQILMYLSKGYKVKDIEQILPLTSSAIQKRIIKMKGIFNAPDDKSLIRQVIEEKYL